MKYYFEYIILGNNFKLLKETCPFKKDCKIGSFYCRKCLSNIEYNIDEHWIICNKIIVKLRKRKLNNINYQ